MCANKIAASLDTGMTLADGILGRSRGSPERRFLSHGDDEYSHGDLFERINAVKAFLAGKGFSGGSRIAILSENSIDYIAAHFAIMLSGLVVVPVDTETSREGIDFIVKSTGAEAVLASEAMTRKMEDSGKAYNIRDVIGKGMKGDRSFTPSGIDPEKLAMILYTSGTTGEPVGVKLTHKNLVANTNSILEYLRPTRDDRLMLVLPMFHCYGMSMMHTIAAAGGEIVLNNRFMFPQKVVEEMLGKKCTIFAGVPTTYKILMRMTKIAQMETSFLRHAYCCAGKLSREDLLKLQKSLPETQIILFYGQTEASPRLSYLPYEFFKSKTESIGRGIPGVELRVVDESGEDCGPGEVGEIIARGDNVSPGYWKDEERTRETFRNGWLYTGDLAKKDDDGFIYIVGRRKDFVKVAGKRFSLTDIEEVAGKMNGVTEAAALMIPDATLGEAVKLFVVPASEGVTRESVMDFCRKNLPTFKVPKEVLMVEEIPKNTFGKVQKRKLLEMGNGKSGSSAGGDTHDG